VAALHTSVREKAVYIVYFLAYRRKTESERKRETECKREKEMKIEKERKDERERKHIGRHMMVYAK
jgi:hypothetical protein